MLPLFYRKRASLKQESIPISQDWEEIGEPSAPVVVKVESPVEMVEVATIESVFAGAAFGSPSVAESATEAAVEVVETVTEAVVEVVETAELIESASDTADDALVIESTTVSSEAAEDMKQKEDAIPFCNEPTRVSADKSSKLRALRYHDMEIIHALLFDGILARIEKIEKELEKIEQNTKSVSNLMKNCPACSGRASIVIDVSRAFDLMRDIFTTGMQYQQRVVSRVCDELCQLAEE